MVAPVLLIQLRLTRLDHAFATEDRVRTPCVLLVTKQSDRHNSVSEPDNGRTHYPLGKVTCILVMLATSQAPAQLADHGVKIRGVEAALP